MKKTFQSPAGYTLLSALIEVFQDRGNKLSIKEIYTCLPEKIGYDLSSEDQKEIKDVLDGYTVPEAGQSDDDTVLSLFKDLGNGYYELIADAETLDALQMEDGAYVSTDVLPECASETVTVEETGSAPVGDTVEASISSSDAYKHAMSTNARNGADIVEAQRNSDQVGGKYSAAKQEAQLQAEAAKSMADDAKAEARDAQAQSAKDKETAANYKQDAKQFYADEQEAEAELQMADAKANQAESDKETAKAAAAEANAQAEKARADAEAVKSQLDQSQKDLEKTEAAAKAAEDKAKCAEDKLDSIAKGDEAAKAVGKLDKKISKAEDQIQEQFRKIENHERQIEDDHTGFMKSLHEAEIRHDKKVIDRKEREIDGMITDAQDQYDKQDLANKLK